MGGCRCCFRRCHVSSAKFPRMHFFRFPHKQAERYKKWRAFSKMDHMLKFSEVRRKNTNICARHFRPECFMNYKMERLIPSAVPTILRLSNDQALDFELDFENGVLVKLEIKSKHLIPPDDFECPLYLMNDKILLDKLRDMRNQQCLENVDLTENYEFSVESEELVLENPKNGFNRPIEILETTQITNESKRQREFSEEEKPCTSKSNKKFKILNTNCSNINDFESKIKMTTPSRTFQLECLDNCNELDIDDSVQANSSHELVFNEEQLFLESETLSSSDEQKNLFQYELQLNKYDAAKVQLISDCPDDGSVMEVKKKEFLNMQDRLQKLQKKCEDFDKFHTKLSLLESENNDLQITCQVNNQIQTKLLSVQSENFNIKNKLKDYTSLKAELLKYCEENKKLKKEVASIEILKAELLSRKQEIHELKKLVETIKSSTLGNTEDEISNNARKETKMNLEIIELKRKLQLAQQELENSETDLKKAKLSLYEMEKENDRLMQDKEELEQSLNNLKYNNDKNENNYRNLQSDYTNIQERHSLLMQKYSKLSLWQSQQHTVTSSENEPKPAVPITPLIYANSLTKAQLFNSIKRYLSASMMTLVRMEMFGSSEREWKSDERQVAVDILRLGETIYKYFTDEWRIRLPALRDVRNWVDQSQVEDEEEDL